MYLYMSLLDARVSVTLKWEAQHKGRGNITFHFWRGGKCQEGINVFKDGSM